tara:strand:- start:227 stop:472 length:246 start_codon:yes stop_codon:yes gene_type:complete
MKSFNDFVTENQTSDEWQLEQIRKEHAGLKKKSLKDLRNHAASVTKIIDTSGLTSKDQAITHILTNKHGRKKCVKALGWEE